MENGGMETGSPLVNLLTDYDGIIPFLEAVAAFGRPRVLVELERLKGTVEFGSCAWSDEPSVLEQAGFLKFAWVELGSCA